MKLFKYLLILSLGILLVGCETNDPLKDQSSLGNQNANVYFNPIDPIADSGSNIECEIEYWSVGDQVKSISLWDIIYLTEDYEISIKDASYTYKNSFDTLQRDQKIYKEYDFDFTDWNPEKNAYNFKTNYLVKLDYKKKTFKNNNTDKTNFVNLISDKAKGNLLTSIVNNKAVLKSVLVDNIKSISLETFNSWYSTSGLTADGLNAVTAAFNAINLEDIIGDKYKKTEAYKIYLSFKVTNGFDEENESSFRSFKVK